METRPFTYETDLRWTGSRTAEITSGERDALIVTPPNDFPGGEHAEWSPEHLFIASLQSCTMLSFIAHCAHNGIEIVSYESHASGLLQRREDDRRYAFTSVEVTVHVKVAGGHAAAARELTGKAERDCFISASTTAEVHTDWRVLE